MILEKITEEDRETLELLHHPVSCAELLFADDIPTLESLKTYTDDINHNFHIRIYQIPFLSYEYLIAEDSELNKESNFELKRKAGSCYGYCGRKIGKSLVGILVDLLEDAIHNFPWTTIFSAFDADHIDPILEPFCTILDVHPFFSLFDFKYRKRPYNINNSLGHKIESVNMTLGSRSPGKNWERVHAHKILIDEHQYETDEVAHKRSQATSEVGCIERFFGITSFKKHTPAGRIFSDLSKENQVVNLSETVSPAWTDKRKKEAIEDYNGEDSLGYRIHVLAEVVESAMGLYDIERIRPCYNKTRTVTRFEVDKDNFFRYKDLIIVDRPNNALKVWVSGDFGISAPSELIVLFEIEKPYGEKNIYRYMYNITLYGLVPDEQTEIYRYLVDTLNAEFVGVDCTDEGGRQIFRDLSKIYSKDRTVEVRFNEKIPVDFETDKEGHIQYKDGEPEYQHEIIIDWSVRRLKVLLYNKLIEISYDYRFDKQFNAMMSMQSGNRIKYGSTEEDHLHQAFQVFAIMEWLKGTFFKAPKKEIPFFKGGV